MSTIGRHRNLRDRPARIHRGNRWQCAAAPEPRTDGDATLVLVRHQGDTIT
ncbi:hypothetical protein XVE_1518 [Xanthomonas vesicatoria ATCC 35937]|uniref:Uncharacterized protein n=1 Tax=Xanthomonas vesicatoria ATCC 35937 TaxID=925775 RepID=F0BBP5_9XANT|nr:hypothetical protein XVE_1518 [Xanthomonas vesicatoria ATCC 35937]